MANKKKISSVVITARQMLKGYTADVDRSFLWNVAPYQMIEKDEKDEDWKMWNMDWLEYIGMQQLNTANRKIQRNYDLANGVINKADYLVVDDNEFGNMIGMIVDKSEGPFSLKYYPIIPNIINILTGEYAKRDKRIIVKAIDDFSENEALTYKKELITNILVQDAQQKLTQNMIQAGIDVNSQEAQQQLNVASELAQAQVKYKTYRGIAEQWGQHVINASDGQFRMYEKEIEGFRDSLVADREFWEVDINEESFDVRVWNPLYTFYHKSPDVYYISEGNYVGQIKLASIPDIINILGAKMTPKQLDMLKDAQYVNLNFNNIVEDGKKHDHTQYWDASRTFEDQKSENVNFNQYVGLRNLYDDANSNTTFNWDYIDRLNYGPYNRDRLLRITKAYWKSQKKVGHLTDIKEDGTIIQDIVDEDYKVHTKPIYDKSITKEESRENLVYGEHIDWIWINEVWGGIKIGPNNTTYYQSKGFGFDPIYIDVKPLKFQFKGQSSLYGCKLPVEGRIFSERNSISNGLVDRAKSHQIIYNVLNNQVFDMLADEVGKVFVMDQNIIPRNSLQGEWGKHNFSKFYQVMKDFQIAPIDATIQNTGTPGTQYQHFQQVDLSKSEQIMTRLKLIDYYKNEAYSIVGISPQRVGEISASESATGVREAINNSYSQTEMYFEQHMNFLMPRVYQMILEAAQFTCAEHPESSINYLQKNEERAWFSIEGWRLLLSDYQIYSMSKADVKATLEQLKRVALENNTAGGSLYEIAQVVMANSPSEIISKLKEADDRRMQQEQAERQHEVEMQTQQQQFLENEENKRQANEDYWKEREIQKDLLIAAMAAGEEPDNLDRDQFNLDRDQHIHDSLLKQKDHDLKERESLQNYDLENKKLAAQKYVADISLKVAKENKTKAEMAKKKKKK